MADEKIPWERLQRYGSIGLSGISLGTSECGKCAHRHWSGSTCEAFPNGIPGAILRGEVEHRLPYPGDRGIQFEPRSED